MEGEADRCSEIVHELMVLAENGDLDAAVFLSDSFRNGTLVPHHPEDPYKFDCLRCANGDLDECWRFHLEGMPVARTFIQDDPELDDDTECERVSDREYIVRTGGATETVFYETEDPLLVICRYDKDHALEKLSGMISKGDCRAAYDYLRIGGPFTPEISALSEKDPRAEAFKARQAMGMGDGETYYDGLCKELPEGIRSDVVGHMEKAVTADPELRFLLAFWYLAGINVPRDPERALRVAVDAAEAGSEDAADLVAMMVDAPYPTDDRHGPPIEDMEALLERCSEGINEYGRLCLRMRPYEPASRPSLQGGIEWRVITNLTRSSCEAYCYGDSVNDSRGYEDDVISIRPFNWGDEDHVDSSILARPNFLFKPSGFNMEWYKYPWRSPQMSEDLPLGGIRRIWRLCIDHLLTGRTFDPGDTASFLDMGPYTVGIPEDLEERVSAVCSKACRIEEDRFDHRCSRSASRPRRYCEVEPGRAVALIAELEGFIGGA